MQDGRSLRAGVLIRTAHLAEATDAELEYLSAVPVAVRTFILQDLSGAPAVRAGLHILHNPVCQRKDKIKRSKRSC